MSGDVVPSAQIIISIFPIVGIVMASVLLFFYLLWRHKQIMLQIKSNSYIKTKYNILGFCLLAGIILTVLGIILTVFFILIKEFNYSLLLGLIPFSLGISFSIYYKFTKPAKNLTETEENFDCES